MLERKQHQGGPRPDAQDDPAIHAEVDRLLSRRTRDIRLRGDIERLYRARIWSQTAKIIRSWMIWVAVLDVLTLALYVLVLPRAVSFSLIVPASIIPPAVAMVVFAWRKPQPTWLQATSLITGMVLILLSVALVGATAGGEFYERHLNIMLFVAITAIIIFGVPLSWTVAIAASAIGLYLVFQLRNPVLEMGHVVAATLFFASGIFATVAARRTMNILAQKTFLFDLRDQRRVTELAKANDRLQLLAKTDPLTGIANRRWMTERLETLWNSDRDRTFVDQAAMLMCDIDHFKKLNDRLGHAEGDRCLVAVAGIIRDSVRRDYDLVARYGGEEFLVLLPGVNADEAISVAERIRQSVEAEAFPNPASRVSRHVTVSIGIAVRANANTAASPEQLQRQADEALYLAKQTGRNRTWLYGSAPPRQVGIGPSR